ncbi:MAG: NAD(P)/FAD-dependent oxidoreductase [Fimbriimonadaceae bacterium]|nr:NAD(P)/FAD-dependent oxidoreductase [Fimbriimonadaceae bacterium]
MQRVDTTIIGGGPAGLFAAFYAGLRGMSVRIVDSLPDLGGQLTALYPEKYIYDMPGFPAVLAKDLVTQMVKQGLQFSPDLVLGETAAHLHRDDDGYSIETDQGNSLPTRTVIISAGAGAFSPTKLGIEGESEWEGRGLAYGVRNPAEYQGKQVLVIGGGDSAFDWAIALHDHGAQVTLVHRRDVFRAHEETVRSFHARGIQMRLWESVVGIGGDDCVRSATLENNQTKTRELVTTDAVIVNIGFKSSLGPIKTWGVEIEKNQVKVDHLYQTNLPGVFAVGDVCTFDGKIKLIATGVGEAATAVCVAKQLIDPSARLFPGHSSDMDLPVNA